MSIKTSNVRDCMSTHVHVIRADQDIAEVISEFVKLHITVAPVVDERGRLLGILSDTDCIMAYLEAGYEQQWNGLVSDYMTTQVETVDADDSITKVANLFLERKFRSFPVVDDNRVTGIIGRFEVLKEFSSTKQATKV